MIRFAAFAMILGAFTSYAADVRKFGGTPCVNNQLDAQLSEIEMKVSNRRFAASLLKELAAGVVAKGESLFLPVFGMSRALSMVRAGVTGVSAEEIDKALGHTKGEFQTHLLDGYQTYVGLLKSSASADVDVRTSSKVWVNDRYRLDPDYQARVTKYFQAEASNLSFASPAPALKAINGDVATTTNGKITSIIDRISSDDAMYLTVANYIAASWADKFDEKLTDESAIFTNAAGKEIRTPMMRKFKSRQAFLDSAEYQAVSLALSGGQLVVDLVIPKVGTLASFVKTVDLDRLNEIFLELDTARKHPGKLNLEMPRLDLDYSANMIPTLKALGMSTPFNQKTAGPDFKGLLTEEGQKLVDLYIGLVQTKAKLELDEKGVVVADATAVGVMKATSIMLDPIPTIRFDRPFLIFVRQANGMILNVGAVGNPGT